MQLSERDLQTMRNSLRLSDKVRALTLAEHALLIRLDDHLSIAYAAEQAAQELAKDDRD